jgi:hypothetical protein
MGTRISTVNSKLSKQETTPAFLVIAAGGSGKTSALSAAEQHQAAGNPFPFYTAAIDTDPRDFDAFDFAINIAPMQEDVSALKKNPERYGPACRIIAERYPELLNSETLGQGARTKRIITQAAFELHEKRIIEGLQKAIHSLLEKGQFQRIMPVKMASLGGGTGSAAMILLQDFFMEPTRKSQVTLGLEPEVVLRPTAFVVDAYAHALQQRDNTTRDWILANIYATRTELAELEKLDMGHQYFFHLGLGNTAGAIFSTIEQVCKANGLMAWEWMANYSLFKSYAVNNLDFNKETGRYNGDDVPENHFSPEEFPEYAESIAK